MPAPFPSFLKKLLLFTAITGLIGFLILALLPAEYRSPAFPFILLFFFGITFFINHLMAKSKGEKLSRFTNRFMLLTFTRLLLYIGVILIYVFLVNRSDAIPFVITFFLYYLAFTTFEVIEMLRSAKEQ
jgi:predicted ABC-type exoprotein transport system permease subunit